METSSDGFKSQRNGEDAYHIRLMALMRDLVRVQAEDNGGSKARVMKLEEMLRKNSGLGN